jgi:hypothetical protein
LTYRGSDGRTIDRGRSPTSNRAAAVDLSLLSAFVTDIVPLSIVLLPDQDAVEKYLFAKAKKPRSKWSRSRLASD